MANKTTKMYVSIIEGDKVTKKVVEVEVKPIESEPSRLEEVPTEEPEKGEG